MSDVAPLLAQKALLEITGPGAVAHVGKVANDVRLPSRAALQQQLGVALSDRAGRGQASYPASPGEAVTLSAVARTVSAILDTPSGSHPNATLQIRGSQALWPDRQPPLAHLLTATLARTVANSGLFYESHLQQYAAGTRTLGQLAQEPQAHLAATAEISPEIPPELPLASVAVQGPGPEAIASMAQAAAVPPGVESLSLLRPGVAGHAEIAHGSEAGTAPAAMALPAGHAARLNPAHLVAAYGSASVHEKGHTPDHDIAGQESVATNSDPPPPGAASHTGSAAPAVHPDAVALVRQQLELLAVPVFRWGGEVWPGTPMDWEIRQEQDESPADDETPQRTWTTRLALTLPRLKAVEVRLSLTGSTLQVRLAAGENATLALLGDGANELPQRLDALGLQLTGLQIEALVAQPPARSA